MVDAFVLAQSSNVREELMGPLGRESMADEVFLV